MFKSEIIAGYEVNLTCSKDGSIVRSACVMVGDSDKPGARSKDANGRNLRRAAKKAVAEALNLDPSLVTVSARYSCLTQTASGLIERRDDSGHVIGTHLPVEKNPAAVALGRLGGSVKSEKKSKSSAANGALGGRPRKTPPASE